MRRRDANNRAMTEAESKRRANEATRSGRWLAPADDFFRPMLALAELAPVDDSCADERRLHERLVAAPMVAVDASELAAIADPDARENYCVFLAFRDTVVAAGSLEAYYLSLVRGGPVAVPPAFIDAVVAAIVARLVDGGASAIERRAAQLLHRMQRVAVRDGRILCADRDAADHASASSSGFDLVRQLIAGAGDDRSALPVSAFGGDAARGRVGQRPIERNERFALKRIGVGWSRSRLPAASVDDALGLCIGNLLPFAALQVGPRPGDLPFEEFAGVGRCLVAPLQAGIDEAVANLVGDGGR